MAKTSMFERLLMNCNTVYEVFQTQECLADNLTASQIFQLRAKYARMSIPEALAYQKLIFEPLRALKASAFKKKIDELSNVLISVCR